MREKSLRRTDRELSKEETLEILNRAEYGVLSLTDKEGLPYGVPVSFAYADGAVWIHGTAGESYKKECIRHSGEACFTCVSDTEVLPSKFSTKYASAIAFGNAHIVDNDADKRKGLEALIDKYSPGFRDAGLRYIDGAIAKTDVIRFDITEITGKSRRD